MIRIVAQIKKNVCLDFISHTTYTEHICRKLKTIIFRENFTLSNLQGAQKGVSTVSILF